MMKIIMLALVLAAVALSGAVSVASAETVPSPLQQVHNGVPTGEVMCSENRVLMVSQSGMPACVFVDSVFVLDKRGFVLLGEITSKAFPIRVVAGADDSSFPPPTLSISRLPNLGETALVEIQFTNWLDVNVTDTEDFRGGDFRTGWKISPAFEIVDAGDLPYNVVTSSSGLDITEIEPQPGYFKYSAFTPLDSGETITYRILVRAVSEGHGAISAWGYIDGEVFLSLYIDDEETMPAWKHRELHPEQHVRSMPAQSDGPPQPERLTKEEKRELNERLAAKKEPTREETVEWFIEYLVISGNSADWAVVSLWHSGILNATEIRTVLAGANFTDSEIDRAMADNVAAQRSATSSTFTVYGTITNDQILLGVGDTTEVHGAQVCAWDDPDRGNFVLLRCAYTNNAGTYLIQNIPLTDPNGSGTVDLRLTVSSNGIASNVRNSANGIYAGTMLDIDDVDRNIINADYAISSTDNHLQGAIFITDSISDAAEYFMTNHLISLPKINVYWQGGLNPLFLPDSLNKTTSYYDRGTDTIYIDGYDEDSVHDDSDNRFVILHEYGHYIMDGTYTSYPDPTNCNPHWVHNSSGTGCAWSEGWASFTALLVDNTATYPRSSSTFYNYELGSIVNRYDVRLRDFDITDDRNRPIGQMVEGRVTSALWDIRDNHNDTNSDFVNNISYDTLMEGDREIVTIFRGGPGTFEGFDRDWNFAYTSKPTYHIMKLHGMDFVTRAPTAHDQTLTVNSGETVRIVLRGDDPDGDDLSFSIVTPPVNGNLSSYGLGSTTYDYTPTKSGATSDSFTYRAYDGHLRSDPATVTITIKQVEAVTFTANILSSSQIELSFSESIAKRFTADDFTLSTGTINSVLHNRGSDRILRVSQIPYNTDVTVTYVGDTYNIGTNKPELVTNTRAIAAGIPNTITNTITESFQNQHSTTVSTTSWTFDAPHESMLVQQSSNLVLTSNNCDSQCIVTLNSNLDTTSPLTITFDRFVDEQVSRNEGLYVQYSTDDTRWTTLASYTHNNRQDTDEWEKASLTLDIAQSSASMRFMAKSSHISEFVEIDNVSISPKVADTTRPTFTHVPPGKTFEATGEQTPLTTAQIGTATATDGVDPNPIVTSNIPPSFDIGTTIITWTATDSSGNSDTATQRITVQDTTPPTITKPANKTFEATGEQTPLTTAQIGTATATDGVDPNPIVTSNIPPSFDIGTTIITWIATDSSGNSDTATQRITIQDTTPPTFTSTIPDINRTFTTGTPAVIFYDLPSARDRADPDVSVTCSPASGSTFPAGPSTITCTATDRYGNSATSTSSVTVTLVTPTPSAPLNLAATSNVYGGFVTLSWDIPADDSVTGHRILRGLSPTSLSVLTSDTGSTTTTYTDASASPNTTYHYQVMSLNAFGASPASGTVSVTTPVARLAAPDNFTVSFDPIDSEIDFRWDAVDGADTYVVQRYNDDYTFVNIIHTSAVSYSLPYSGTLPYSALYMVSAISESERSIWSVPVLLEVAEPFAAVHDGFDSLGTWNLTTTTSSAPGYSNYTLSVDSQAGNPASALKVSGNGFLTFNTVTNTFDLAGLSRGDGLRLSVDMRITASGTPYPTLLPEIKLFMNSYARPVASQHLDYAVNSTDGGWRTYTLDVPSNLLYTPGSLIVTFSTVDLTSDDRTTTVYFDNFRLDPVAP